MTNLLELRLQSKTRLLYLSLSLNQVIAAPIKLCFRLWFYERKWGVKVHRIV